MKYKLLARLIKKLIQPEALEYFNSKLEEFHGDMNALLCSKEAVEDLTTFLIRKEEMAIEHIKAEYGIDINELDVGTKRLIFNDVEHKIFYK